MVGFETANMNKNVSLIAHNNLNVVVWLQRYKFLWPFLFWRKFFILVLC
jgi:hypothetical protein